MGEDVADKESITKYTFKVRLPDLARAVSMCESFLTVYVDNHREDAQQARWHSVIFNYSDDRVFNVWGCPRHVRVRDVTP